MSLVYVALKGNIKYGSMFDCFELLDFNEFTNGSFFWVLIGLIVRMIIRSGHRDCLSFEYFEVPFHDYGLELRDCKYGSGVGVINFSFKGYGYLSVVFEADGGEAVHKKLLEIIGIGSAVMVL